MEYANGTIISTSEPSSNEIACAGCIGCDPDTVEFPTYDKNIIEESLVDIPLLTGSYNGPPFQVSLNQFDLSQEVQRDSSINPNLFSSNPENNVTSSPLASFSFSLETPHKGASNTMPSFQLKTPTFSFQPADNSASIFGGKIFSPPMPNISSTSPASPFINSFVEQQVISGNPPQPVSVSANALDFSSPSFTQPQNASVDVNNDQDEEEEERDEDEYEDVDDEEDECMFEEDAHILIQTDSNSSEGMLL